MPDRLHALPNVKGRIDHLAIDVKGQRLFVAAVDNHTLEVIDLKAGHPLRTIPDLGEPQGVFYDVSSNRLFVACALDGVTKVFDGTTLQAIASAKLPDDADNIRYDARGKRVIVGYAGAKQARRRARDAGQIIPSQVRHSAHGLIDVLIEGNDERGTVQVRGFEQLRHESRDVESTNAQPISNRARHNRLGCCSSRDCLIRQTTLVCTRVEIQHCNETLDGTVFANEHDMKRFSGIFRPERPSAESQRKTE